MTLYSQPRADVYPNSIAYFIPQGQYSFNAETPEPKNILGFEVGQLHADWRSVTDYMYALEKASPRVSVKEFGRTNQLRPFIQVVITSEKNQGRLEELREEHLRLSEAGESGALEINRMPVVVNLMYSIHGNEPSGVNSSLVLAYYLAALQGEEIEEALDKMIVVLTPGLNPDGINRFASWVNSSRSYPDVADLSSREFAEAWPSSRTNHYWADCNRDWLMAQHPEGRNALEMYFQWLPNVVGDFHEQGGDRTYYFSPGDSRRTHPLTLRRNQELTAQLTSFTACSLDKIGTLYHSKERYDDYYYGKGAAYGDIHGSICVLFEQLASRGHLRPTMNFGNMSFAFTIRNQVFAAIALIRGAYEMKTELLAYQRDFFANSKKEAAKSPVKAYIFDARGSKAIAYHFIENMRRHRIEVYRLGKPQTIRGHVYDPSDAYIIPLNQKYSETIRTIMENVTEYQDSTFYDISTWTFTHAYNLRHDLTTATDGLLGEKIDAPTFPEGQVQGGKSDLAYIFDNSQYYAPAMVAGLLRKGLIVKAGSRPFHRKRQGEELSYGYGTILVQTQNQPLDKDQLFATVDTLARTYGIDVRAVESGLMDDYDLGTPHFVPLSLPRIAVLSGPGMGIAESGEVWMMLSERFAMSPVMIDHSALPSADLDKYNVLIMAHGTPNRELPAATVDNIKRWIDKGGTFIAAGSSYKWTNKAGLTNIKTLPPLLPAYDTFETYATRAEANAGNQIEGVILNCRLDISNPLGWGYEQGEIAVFRQGTDVFQATDDPYASPLSYLPSPRLSGCISDANLQRLAGAPAIITRNLGKGRLIAFADNMNFRMYWFGTNKLFVNAILFGQLL
jgi:hypothetical protein